MCNYDCFLPTAVEGELELEPATTVTGDSPCPCCGYSTIPNGGDALGFICPICFWEIDLFLQNSAEPSDENNGLSLLEAQRNYRRYGAVLPRFKQHCRVPTVQETPQNL